MSEQSAKTLSERHYEIRHSDLPLCCPMPGVSGWDAHPRVFLDIEKTGKIACPYCGTLYTLVDD